MADLTWRRSSRCDSNTCVEVAWRKSSHSVNNGTCVEMAFHRSSRCVGEAHCLEVGATAAAVNVRDSKLGAGSPILSFTPAAWSGFVAGIKAGHFDLPGGDHA